VVPPVPRRTIVISGKNTLIPRLVETSLRNMMTSHVGVVRDGAHLAKAVRLFADIERNSGSIALRNMATAALLVAASAWSRRESRGAHCRADYPAEVPALAHRTITTLSAAREVAAALAAAAPARAVEPETA
jgi:L-aspartate oxidase